MKNLAKIIGFITSFIMLISIFSVSCFATGSLDWEMSFGPTLQKAIAANDNMCISVGSSGIIFKSTDGLKWTKGKTISDYDLNDIVWTGKEFIVVGDYGFIMSSTDGENWVKMESGTSKALKKVLSNGKVLVAYGDSAIVSSTDGCNWVAKEFTMYIDSMALNNGKFIALDSGIEGITSTDGINWIKCNTLPKTFRGSYGSITAFKGDFVITSSFGAGEKEIYTSKDGVSWNTIEVADLAYMIPSEINVTDDFLLLSGRYSAIAYTENITDWTKTNLEDMINDSSSIDESLVLDLIFFKGHYIGVMSTLMLDSTFIISKDFKTWQEISVQPSYFVLNSIATDGTSYIIVGQNGAAYKSSDALNWVPCSFPSKDNLLSVSWDGNQFVVLDEKGNIYSTKDGVEWSIVSKVSDLYTFQDGSIVDYSKLIYTQNRYFLLYNYPNTLIYSSEDLKIWDKINGIDKQISDITSNGKILVAVSYDQSIFTSIDAKEWTMQITGINSRLSKVIWGGNQFVAIGNSNTFAISNDGIIWTVMSTKNSEVIDDICWDGKGYLAVDNAGRIIYSVDLFDWSQLTNNTNLYGATIVWNGYRYIAVGETSIKTAVPKDIIKVLVNGSPLRFDVAPEMSNNRTLVPARYIFEALRAEVQWDEATKKVTIKGNGKEVTLKINDAIAYVNNEAVQLDAVPVVVNGRTLIPLRFVAENFNAEVNWDQDTQTVSIKTFK